MTRAIHVAVALSLVCGCATAPLQTSSPPPPSSGPITPPPTAQPTITLQPTPTPAEVEPLRIPLSVDGPVDLELADDEAWILASDSGELLILDLEDQSVRELYAVGSTPTAMSVAAGYAALVADLAATTNEHLLVMDAHGSPIGEIATGPIAGLSPADQGLWWALEQDGSLLLLDAEEGVVVQETNVEIEQNVHADVVAAAGSAWVSSDPTPLLRVSQEPVQVEATIDVGGGIPFDVDSDLVWGARPDEIWAVDPATNEVSQRVPLENLIEILAMDVADGEAWVAARHPAYVGTILRIDLGSGDVMDEWPASLPASIKVGTDAVWAVDYETDELIRIPR